MVEFESDGHRSRFYLDGYNCTTSVECSTYSYSLCPLVMDSPLISHLTSSFLCASSLPRVSEPGHWTLRCGDRTRWAPHHRWVLGAGLWVWFSALVLDTLLWGADPGGVDPEVLASEWWPRRFKPLEGVELVAYCFPWRCFRTAALLSLLQPNIGLSMHSSFIFCFHSLLGSWHDLPAYQVDAGGSNAELDYDFENDGWED
jgi:hypothetical protein